MWPNSEILFSGFQEDDYEDYLRYIGEEISAISEHRVKFATCTFEGIVAIIHRLRADTSWTKAAAMENIRSHLHNGEDTAILRSMELGARLWLNLNINSASLAVGPIQANVNAVEWESSLSLNDLIMDCFQRVSINQIASRVVTTQIDPSFTAASLVGLCGFTLHWTSNLADHLQFDRRRRILTVYQHKISLINHLKEGTKSVFPIDVLEEAIDTLNLLFPFGENSTRRLLYKEGKRSFYSLGNCKRDRACDIQQFSYWRNEILDVLDVFNGPAHNLRQLLADQRNLSDLLAIWIAIFVALLTLISIGFGTIQTVFSIKQYNLAKKQTCVN